MKLSRGLSIVPFGSLPFVASHDGRTEAQRYHKEVVSTNKDVAHQGVCSFAIFFVNLKQTS